MPLIEFEGVGSRIGIAILHSTESICCCHAERTGIESEQRDRFTFDNCRDHRIALFDWLFQLNYDERTNEWEISRRKKEDLLLFDRCLRCLNRTSTTKRIVDGMFKGVFVQNKMQDLESLHRWRCRTFSDLPVRELEQTILRRRWTSSWSSRRTSRDIEPKRLSCRCCRSYRSFWSHLYNEHRSPTLTDFSILTDTRHERCNSSCRTIVDLEKEMSLDCPNNVFSRQSEENDDDQRNEREESFLPSRRSDQWETTATRSIVRSWEICHFESKIDHVDWEKFGNIADRWARSRGRREDRWATISVSSPLICSTSFWKNGVTIHISMIFNCTIGKRKKHREKAVRKDADGKCPECRRKDLKNKRRLRTERQTNERHHKPRFDNSALLNNRLKYF